MNAWIFREEDLSIERCKVTFKKECHGWFIDARNVMSKIWRLGCRACLNFSILFSHLCT
jgi:hypothetical protein